MKRMKRNMDEVLKHSLPSTPEQEMESALQRISNRLWSEGVRETRTEETLDSIPVRQIRRLSWITAAAIAATIVLAVLVPARVLRSAPAVLEDGAGSRRVQFGEVVSPRGGAGGTLNFPDGSRVEMRNESEISLERGNDGVSLRVRRGDVIVNAAEQLHVQTKDMSAVGKVFLVKAQEEGSRIAAIGGEALVQQGAMERKLLPGEQIATNPQMSRALPLQEELAWSREIERHMALVEQAVAEAHQLVAAIRQSRETFELVSIRPTNPNGGEGLRGGPGTAGYGCAGNGPTLDPGRIVFNNQNLYTLVTMAYGFNCFQAMSAGLISGGPSFVGTDQYVIQVTIPREAGFQPESGRRFDLSQFPKVQAMLRNMLEDRFKLVVHREKKEVPGYALTVAKGGHKLRSDAPFLPKDAPTPPGAGDFRIQGANMEALARLLTTALRKSVVDRTGITGSYPVFVYFATPEDDIVPKTSPYPDLPAAFEEQLGLKLEPIRITVDTLVIDHAEKPTEN